MNDQLSALPSERRGGLDRRAAVPKSKLPTLLVCAAFVVLFIWTVVQQIQISRMGNADQADRQELALKGVNEHVSVLAEELATVTDKQKDVMLRTDFAAAQDELSKKVDNLKEQVSNIKQSGGSDAEYLAFKAQIESIQAGMDALDKRITALSQRPVPAAQPVKAFPKPRSTPTQPVVKLNPPFQVIGVEDRGGERFLSIAPAGSTRLDQIMLIRPGDTRYDWELRSLGSTTAEFQVHGSTQVLTLQ